MSSLPHRPCDPEQIKYADRAMAFMMEWIRMLSESEGVFREYVSLFK